jgi:hypothetical protein
MILIDNSTLHQSLQLARLCLTDKILVAMFVILLGDPSQWNGTSHKKGTAKGSGVSKRKNRDV